MEHKYRELRGYVRVHICVVVPYITYKCHSVCVS